MELRYISENNTIEFSPKKFLPMTYRDLICTIQSDSPLKYEGFADSFNTITDYDNLTSGNKFSFDINFKHPLSIFALVEGGWLPLPFANPSIFLVDRNVISVLSKFSQETHRTDFEDTKWWVNFIQHSSFVINPILYAFEGDKQRLPSLNEFIDSFEEASLKIAKQFPHSKLIRYTEQTYRDVYKIVSGFADRTDREINFLMKTVNKIINRVADSNLPEIRSEIIHDADKYKLLKKSLLVFAVLSCLYEKKDGSGFLATRKIIKPKKKYTEKDAYNAIADIRLIECFIATFALIQLKDIKPFALCTCDKSLAAFWCALEIQYIKLHKDKLKINFTMSEELFPRLNDVEREELNQVLS